jgi:hypothetical protein
MYVKYITNLQRIYVIFNFVGINDTSKDICRNFLEIQIFKLNIDVNVNTQYVFLLFKKPFFQYDYFIFFGIIQSQVRRTYKLQPPNNI